MSNLITKISLWQTLDKFWHWEVVRYSGQDHHSSYVVASGVVSHRDDGFEPTKNTAWGRAALSAFGRAAASAMEARDMWEKNFSSERSHVTGMEAMQRDMYTGARLGETAQATGAAYDNLCGGQAQAKATEQAPWPAPQPAKATEQAPWPAPQQRLASARARLNAALVQLGVSQYPRAAAGAVTSAIRELIHADQDVPRSIGK